MQNQLEYNVGTNLVRKDNMLWLLSINFQLALSLWNFLESTRLKNLTRLGNENVSNKIITSPSEINKTKYDSHSIHSQLIRIHVQVRETYWFFHRGTFSFHLWSMVDMHLNDIQLDTCDDHMTMAYCTPVSEIKVRKLWLSSLLWNMSYVLICNINIFNSSITRVVYHHHHLITFPNGVGTGYNCCFSSTSARLLAGLRAVPTITCTNKS